MYDSFYFFFFSSRRRHTRSLRDWSSDVCSSDLTRCGAPRRVEHHPRENFLQGCEPHLRFGRCGHPAHRRDRKSTRLNSSHVEISYAVFCLKKKKETEE